MKTPKAVRGWVLGGLGMAVVGSVGAATILATADMTVKVEVITKCEVKKTADVDFGKVEAGDTRKKTQVSMGKFTVNCPSTVAYEMRLSSANGWKMKKGDKEVKYKLFQKGDHTVDWGDSQVQAGTGSGKADEKIVYGKIEDNVPTDAPAGADYTDTVTITVTV